MTRVGRWFSLERPPVLPAVSRGAAAAPHSLDDPPPGPFPDRQGRGKPPTPHPQLCLKSKAGIRKGDGLFSGILQRVCSWALFKNRLFPPKGKGEGRGRERSRLFRVAGDAVPPPRTPGTEVLPDAPRSVVSATRGWAGDWQPEIHLCAPGRTPRSSPPVLVFCPPPSCKVLEGWDVAASVSLPVSGHAHSSSQDACGDRERTLSGEARPPHDCTLS